MVIKLSKVQEKILKDLAKEQKTIYDIALKDKTAVRSTVSEAIKKLKKLGLIELKHQEKSRIPGKEKKFYGLTFRGLVWALKLGLKLNQIPNWEEIVSSWISNYRFPESIVELREKFKLNVDKVQKELFEYIKLNQEQMEAFLRHYDLEFSDDLLICTELYSFVLFMKTGFLILNRQKRRVLKELLRDVPEHYKMMFLIPELWQVNMKLESDEA